MPTWERSSLPALIASSTISVLLVSACLAGSVLVAVGDRAQQDASLDAFIRSAGELKLGDGLDDYRHAQSRGEPRVEEKRIRAAPISRG